MNRRNFLIVCASLFLNACVQVSVFKGDGYAFIKSNYPVVSINGVEVEPSYTVDIEADENSLVIVYHTYQYEYYYTFTWIAMTNTAYKVTDQDNKYPLTLYRWIRKNSLWASRLDPIDPLSCDQKQKP